MITNVLHTQLCCSNVYREGAEITAKQIQAKFAQTEF